MSLIRHVALTGLLALLMTGCASTPQVFTDYDPSQSFADYQTFTWVGDDPMIVTGNRPISPLNAERVKSAIQSELESKGFTMAADGRTADFAVAFTVGARDQLDIQERQVIDYYGPHWTWGWDYYSGRFMPPGIPRTEISVREYVEGSLAIDVFDVERKSPVWHADSARRLNRDDLNAGADVTEQINAAVAELLKNFPPTVQ